MAYDVNGNWDPNGQYDGSGNPVSTTPGGTGSEATTAAATAPAAPTPAAPLAPTTADPSLLGPNYTGPAPASFGGPATSADQVPVPSVDPGVVYTDPSGTGYTPDQLYAQRNALLQDPANARIRDILQTYGYGGAPAAAAPSGAAQAGPSAAVAAGPSAFQAQIRQMIMDQLAKAGQPVDPNSPEIAAMMSSASDAGVRASTEERNALAERLYAQGGGLNTNALTQQVQQSGEKQAATLSTLKGQLLMNQYNQKAQQLQQDMQMALASGDAESARAVQLAIANLQAAVQREGLGINLAEFGQTQNQNAVLAGLNG